MENEGTVMRKMFGMCVAVIAGSFLISACAQAGGKISEGSNVTLDYSMEVDGLNVVPKDKPQTMKFMIGDKTRPQELERQLKGLKKGDRKNIKLRPDQAFGPYRSELLVRVPKTQLPAGMNVAEGAMVSAGPGGRPVRVAKVLEDSVVFDQNHPLAGKALSYQIEVKDVR